MFWRFVVLVTTIKKHFLGGAEGSSTLSEMVHQKNWKQLHYEKKLMKTILVYPLAVLNLRWKSDFESLLNISCL